MKVMLKATSTRALQMGILSHSKPLVFPRVDSTWTFPHPITKTQIHLTREMCSNRDDEHKGFPFTQKSAIAEEFLYRAATLKLHLTEHSELEPRV